MKHFTMLLLFCLFSRLVLAQEFIPEDLGELIINADEAAEVHGKIDPVPTSKTQQLRYQIEDVTKQLVKDGRLSVEESGRFAVPIRLPTGYYELRIEGTKLPTGLIVNAPASGTPDPFFCCDAAISWNARSDSFREQQVRVLKKMGISMARERFFWRDLQKGTGNLDFKTFRRYEACRSFYQKENLPVLEIFHDSPPVFGELGKYPDNLLLASRSIHAITQHWQATLGGVEMWNEPDIEMFAANLPPDQYAALAKTVAYGLRDLPPEIPRVGGAIALPNDAFVKNVIDNGVLDVSSAFSFHTYYSPEKVESLVRQYQAWMKENDRSDLPLWLTETGRPWSTVDGRPSPTELRSCARQMVMNSTEAKVAGVARNFAFIIKDLGKPSADSHGMTDDRGTPLLSLAAYVNMIRQLSNSRYLGTIDLRQPQVRLARGFAKDEEVVIVVYTGTSDLKEPGFIAPDFRIESAYGIDGRELKIAGRKISLADGLIYLKTTSAALGKRLRQEKSAMASKQEKQTDDVQRGTTPACIVLRPRLPSEEFRPTTEGYQVLLPSQFEKTFPFEVWNLGDERQQVRLHLLPIGDNTKASAAGNQTIELEAGEKQVCEWKIDLNGVIGGPRAVSIGIEGTYGENQKVLPAVVQLLSEPVMDKMLASAKRREKVSLDPRAWKSGSPADVQLRITNTTGNSWQLYAGFDKSRWSKVMLDLPKGTDLTGWDGLLIRWRCGAGAGVSLEVSEPGDIVYTSKLSQAPGDDQWHTSYLPFDGMRISQFNSADPNSRLDLNRIVRFGFVVSSQDVPQQTLEISDCYVLGGFKASR